MNQETFKIFLTFLLKNPSNIPEDWQAESTTYDLPRHYSKKKFSENIHKLVDRNNFKNNEGKLKLDLINCGHPYDYSRLGQPFSTLYEMLIKKITNVSSVISFASRTKPFLSVIESRDFNDIKIKIYNKSNLIIDNKEKESLKNQNIDIFENWKDQIPNSKENEISIYVSNQNFIEGIEKNNADAITYLVNEGGVLLIKNKAKVDQNKIQIIRKRTVSALLVKNSIIELKNILGINHQEEKKLDYLDECNNHMSKIYKNISVENNIYFCTGLAAESSVFRSATKEISQGDVVTLYYARNGYGGTGQLISEILSKEKYIDPKSLIVLGKNEKGEETTLIDNFINDLWKSEGRKAVLFLETPTNPELQMHDFDKLIKSLHKYKEDFNITIPVIVDTTMAPLYQLFDQEYSNDWPFIIVKSGSKYYTKGKATLGVAFCGEDKIAKNILKKAKEYGNYTDSFAKSYQLKKLSEGLTDLEIRMKKITSNTKEIADNLKIKIKSKKLNFICYTMTEEQIKAGLYSGIISFYLPPAPTKELDLVDEFVNYLLRELPNLVRNRVSYGQSSNNSETDFVYVINPQESTQGSLSKEVKEAQKRNNVQICRISVPANCEVNKINQVINQFIDSKYS